METRTIIISKKSKRKLSHKSNCWNPLRKKNSRLLDGNKLREIKRHYGNTQELKHKTQELVLRSRRSQMFFKIGIL